MKTEKEILDAIKANEEANLVMLKELEIIKSTPPKITAEEWLEKIWFVAYRNSGNSPDNCVTFYENSERKSDGWLFQQDWENKKLYYSYYRVYQILEREYRLNTNEINNLVMNVVSRDLNREVLTPWWTCTSRWTRVSRDLNREVLTPFPNGFSSIPKVSRDLNREVLTPQNGILIVSAGCQGT